MKGPSPERFQAEEARIRAVYAKRPGNKNRYSWFNPGHLFMVQQRERRLLALLKHYGYTALDKEKIPWLRTHYLGVIWKG